MIIPMLFVVACDVLYLLKLPLVCGLQGVSLLLLLLFLLRVLLFLVKLLFVLYRAL